MYKSRQKVNVTNRFDIDLKMSKGTGKTIKE